ncbi:MAG: TIM barrel protein [Clostridia bacterium]|nr:TIM barrel protein [Clostridia bacterium]
MIKFGPSGNSESFAAEGHKSTVEAAVWCKERDLDCYEYSFGRGITLGAEKAIEIGKVFKENGISISVHAPYYINLANPDEDKAFNSYNYILQSAQFMRYMQGERIVFHPAAQGKASREEAVSLTLDRIKTLRDMIYENDMQDMKFCPETMGKLAQIGTVEEITEFCSVDDCFIPTIDFGHVNAREQGSLKSVADYKIRLEYMIEKLGMKKMKNFHAHFSKIQYSSKGEIRHLTFEDKIYGPEFEPLAVALKDLDLEPVIICESAGTQAEDAMAMKKIYFSL